MRYESAVDLVQEIREELHGRDARDRLLAEAAATHPAERLKALMRSSLRLEGVGRWLDPSDSTLAAAAALRSRRPAVGVALGKGPEDCRVAVRVFAEHPDTWKHVARIEKRAAGEIDLDVVGPQRAYALASGASVGRLQPGPVTGTLGCFVQRTGESSPELLSCRHVIATMGPGPGVGQVVLSPGPEDSGTGADAVGAVSFVAPFRRSEDNAVDAALARPYPTVTVDGADLGNGQVLAGVYGPPVHSDRTVVKTGRTTQRTVGWVRAAPVGPIPVEYDDVGGGVGWLDTAYEIRSRQGKFSAPGDSGALVWDESSRQALGLLVSGPVDLDDDAGPTYVTPMPVLLSALGATMAL